MSARKLNTNVHCSSLSVPIGYDSPIMLMGSCFSQNIGERSSNAGLHCISNPFGISFNPISIAESIDRISQSREVKADELRMREDIYFHYSFHSSFSGLDPHTVVSGMNGSIAEANNSIREISHLIITLGTAWVYRLKEDGRVVNNCHKIPQSSFSKELLDRQEIIGSLTKAIHQVKEMNPELSIVFTLSPVRHWKDGAQENSVSKAILRTAIAELQKAESVEYFPSYEIMMDELRDYRFYAEDLLHPSELAQDIIWKRFIEAACDESTKDLLSRVEKYKRMRAHRSLIPNSNSDRLFKEELANEEKKLKSLYPFIQLD